jgi:hypothetical protein
MGIAVSFSWARLRSFASIGSMPLHLIKLAVGAESLADSREWTAERMTETERARAPAY